MGLGWRKIRHDANDYRYEDQEVVKRVVRVPFRILVSDKYFSDPYGPNLFQISVIPEAHGFTLSLDLAKGLFE